MWIGARPGSAAQRALRCGGRSLCVACLPTLSFAVADSAAANCGADDPKRRGELLGLAQTAAALRARVGEAMELQRALAQQRERAERLLEFEVELRLLVRHGHSEWPGRRGDGVVRPYFRKLHGHWRLAGLHRKAWGCPRHSGGEAQHLIPHQVAVAFQPHAAQVAPFPCA